MICVYNSRWWAFVGLLTGGMAITATPAAAFWPFDSNHELFVQACEGVLKARLMAPAGYVRVEAEDGGVRLATIDEYMGWDGHPERKQDDVDFAMAHKSGAESIRSSFKLFAYGTEQIRSVIITYDAPNSFNTPIRSRSLCTMISDEPMGPVTPSYEQNMQIDGVSERQRSHDAYTAAMALPRRSEVDVNADLAAIEAGSSTTP